MFDFDAGKLILVGIVALIVIGPKDLPRVLRQVGQAVSKMRRMASEFQGQFMDAMREADQAELKKEILSIADSAKEAVKGTVDLDPTREIRAEVETALNEPAPPALARIDVKTDEPTDPTIGMTTETPAAPPDQTAPSLAETHEIAPSAPPVHAGAVDALADLRNMTTPPSISGFDDMRTPMMGPPPRSAPPPKTAGAGAAPIEAAQIKAEQVQRDDDGASHDEAPAAPARSDAAAARARAARAARNGRARRAPRVRADEDAMGGRPS